MVNSSTRRSLNNRSTTWCSRCHVQEGNARCHVQDVTQKGCIVFMGATFGNVVADIIDEPSMGKTVHFLTNGSKEQQKKVG